MFVSLVPVSAFAGGISVDAGLTPAQDRWIVRSHIRSMNKKDDHTGMNREMDMFVVPVVLAYGLRPDFAIMVKQKFMYSKMTMMGNTTKETSLSDLFILAKYKAYRINAP